MNLQRRIYHLLEVEPEDKGVERAVCSFVFVLMAV